MHGNPTYKQLPLILEKSTRPVFRTWVPKGYQHEPN
jgi:hypothetical protein